MLQREVLKKGFELHVMQRNPHLVLLDTQYYQSHIRPVMAKWVLLWLYKNFVGNVNVSKEVLLAYLQGMQYDFDTSLMNLFQVNMLKRTEMR
jgi:hypothetical protein